MSDLAGPFVDTELYYADGEDPDPEPEPTDQLIGCLVAGVKTTVAATRAIAFGLDDNVNVHDTAGMFKVFGDVYITGDLTIDGSATVGGAVDINALLDGLGT